MKLGIDWRAVLDAIFKPKEYVPPACLIDGLPMRPIGYTADGNHIVYECARGHTYSPGVNVGDRDKIIERTKGDSHGEI